MNATRRDWIIVAIAVVGIVGFLMLSVDVIPPTSQTADAIHMCKRRIQRYAIEHNALPSALIETKEIEGYDNSIKDAWGRPIIYGVDTNGLVTLASLGKDNKPGGTGDGADMIGVYPSRQPSGRWSDELVGWIKDPFEDFRKRRITAEPNDAANATPPHR
ncbi:MAG: type II secretion system protein GspG [Verrucomicrobiia bacterium]